MIKPDFTGDIPFSIWAMARFEGDAEGTGADDGLGGYAGLAGYDVSSDIAGIGYGPSASSPAGGAQAASGMQGYGGYSGPSASSPAGGAAAASGMQGYGGGDSFGGSVGGGGIGGFGGSASGGGLAGDIAGAIGGLMGMDPGAVSGSLGALGGLGGAAQPGNPGSANSLGPSTYGPGWGPSPSTPSFRSAEDQSMAAYNAFSTPARAAEDYSMTAFNNLSRPTARSAEDQSMGKYNAYQSAFDVIGKAESRQHSYNSVVDENKAFNLTDMTIAQVMAFQQSRKAKGKNTAVGRYQTIAPTLSKAVKDLSINPNTTKFTPAIQDYIAMELVDNRADRASKSKSGLTAESLASELSKEWAGLATPSGKSYYSGVGNNAANVSYADTLGIAQGLVSAGIAGNNAAPASTAAPATAVASNLPDYGPAPVGRPSIGPAPSLAGSIGMANSPIGAMASAASSTLSPSSTPTSRSAEDVSTATLAASATPTNPYGYIGVTDDQYASMQNATPQPALGMPGVAPAPVSIASASGLLGSAGMPGVNVAGSASGSLAAPAQAPTAVASASQAPEMAGLSPGTQAAQAAPSAVAKSGSMPSADDVLSGRSDYGATEDGQNVIRRNEDGTLSVIDRQTGVVKRYSADGTFLGIEGVDGLLAPTAQPGTTQTAGLMNLPALQSAAL